MAHGPSKTYAPETRIEFPTILTNAGGGYNAGTNEFVCPTSGLYYFALTTTGFDSNNAIMEIWMDGERLVTSLNVNSNIPTGSNSVAINCGSGGKVYIQGGTMYNVIPYGTNNNWGNTVTFSGFLISGDDV